MNDPLTRRAALARAAYFLGGALSAPTVAAVLAGCDRGAQGAGATSRALSAEQKETVAVLGEHILPRTDTPGARDAQVHEFIDVLMTDYYAPEERDRFLAGLARVDERARRAWGEPFLKASPERQAELVRALNGRAYPDPAPTPEDPTAEPVTREGSTETGHSGAPETNPTGGLEIEDPWDPQDVGREAWFRTLKELVVVAYYTSEVGATRELRMNPMGAWRADIPYAAAGQAWA